MADSTSDVIGNSIWRFVLIGLSVIILILTIKDSIFLFYEFDRLNHVSGVWIGLAQDLKDGVFYRPLHGELGYGGTRFFPLHFLLHAFSMVFIPSPLVSGAFLTLSCGILYFSGMFVWLRRIGLSKWMAFACSAFPLYLIGFRIALGSIRGDMLPAALTVWGLAFGFRRTRGSDLLAALFFTLAFAAKVTSIHGAAACVIHRFIRGNRRESVGLLGWISLGYVLSLAFMFAASGGRFFEIMRVCSSGGATLSSALKGPINMLHLLLKAPGFPSFALYLLSIVAFFSASSSDRRRLPMIYFIAALFLTIFIFGSPGIVLNHVIDLDIAAVSVFAQIVVLQKGNERNAFDPTILLTICAFVALAMPAIRANSYSHYIYTNIPQKPYNEFLEKTAEITSRNALNDTRPLLSENPMVPIFSGDSVFLLDPFMFARLIQTRPEEEIRLAEMITRREFRAIILMEDPETADLFWYQQHLSWRIVGTIQENYRKFDTVGGTYHIYFPKDAS
jgi:hypothetical protein